MPAKKTPAKKTPARRKAPAKKTVASKPRTTRASAAASKEMAYENLWEDELTTQYSAMKKNNFLSLIVLGLGTLLVVIGIYIQVNKDEPATTTWTINTGNTNNTPTGSSDTLSGNLAVTGDDNGDDQQTTTPTTTSGTFPVDAQKMVVDFYNYFNQDQFDRIPELYDNNFRTVPGLVQYFNPTRLQNRKPNIVGDMQVSEVNAVIDHPIVQRNSNAMVVQYKTTYTLKQDGQQHGETRYAYVVRGNGTYKLNGFECQENCATSPFFQLR